MYTTETESQDTTMNVTASTYLIKADEHLQRAATKVEPANRDGYIAIADRYIRMAAIEQGLPLPASAGAPAADNGEWTATVPPGWPQVFA